MDSDVGTDMVKALRAINEIMELDKGPTDREWVNWCNKHLSLVKQYGFQTFTIEFF